jgi:amidophosphoribosyltransferase
MFDKFNDECGIAGVFGDTEAANLVYLCLYALQHRGQEGAGISASDRQTHKFEKGLGLVADIFTHDRLSKLNGDIAIGHNRYSTSGANHIKNVQPIIAEIASGPISIAHNGNIVNAENIKNDLVENGAIFTSTSDSEIIIHLLARNQENNIIDQIIESVKPLKGAFSLLFMINGKLVGIRDPKGMRPLILGKIRDGYVLVSETVALDLIEAEFIREVNPGELLIIDDNGLTSLYPFEKEEQKSCIFEHIYFARPDSYLFGEYVYDVRIKMGKMLAKELPVDADVVVPVPDSGIVATLGYAEESKIPFQHGMVRNHYVGRTFIEPAQSIRHFGVKIKLNPVKSIIKGKKVVVIDDSIVRGTTSRKIVKMLREAGATEVHLRISSPPTIYPCFYGIDTPSRKELIASSHTIEEIRKYVTADTLAFLSVENMLKCVENNYFCDACFTGNYPTIYKDGKAKNPKSEA